jgi:hypothetical protein
MEEKGLLNSQFEGLTLVSKGKVRDIFPFDPYL